MLTLMHRLLLVNAGSVTAPNLTNGATVPCLVSEACRHSILVYLSTALLVVNR